MIAIDKDEKIRKQISILLVEDDSNDILIIKSAIHKIKFNVLLKIIENGEDAIAYLSGDGQYNDRTQFPIPNLILIDLKLPRKSGHEILEWLGNQKELKRIPKIVLSSSLRSIDINRAYDLGVNSYLAKPSSFDSWLNIIKNIQSYWVQLNEYPDVNLSN